VTASATYLCGACGKVAATVTLVAPGQPDPRMAPEPPGVPPGRSTLLGTVFPRSGRLSIDGGPVSLTLAPVPMEEAATALESGDAAALYELDSEYAPFWCPRCDASYCRDHYLKYEVYDEGFFDCIRGVCPQGHERTLED
jgi:hypothetical protein